MACIAAIGVHTTQYINVILTFRDCSLWARLPVAKCSTQSATGSLIDALVVIAHTCPPHAVAGAHARLSCRQQATLDAGDTYCSSCARWRTAHAEKTPLCEV